MQSFAERHGGQPTLGMPLRRLAIAIAATAAMAMALALGASSAAASWGPGSVPSQADVQAALDRVVANGAPGATAVIEGPDGREEYSAGVQDVSDGTPISPDSAARVASVTKMFTASLTLGLVADGRLGLRDRVARYLPRLVADRRLRVHHLLRQTSGVADVCVVGPPTLCEPPPETMARRWLASRLVRIGVGAPPPPPASQVCPGQSCWGFAPGRGWGYSNTNYVILGMIASRVTGQGLRGLYQRRIFGPLGLDHTQFPTTPAMPDPHSRGYDVLNQGAPVDVTPTNPTRAWGAGAIVSTPGDLIAFTRALLDGRVVPPELLQRMRAATPGSLQSLEGGGVASYGMGLMRFTSGFSCGGFGHLGDYPGYHSLAISNPAGTRGAGMYVNADVLPTAGVVAVLEAQRRVGCRMRFGRIGAD